MSAALSRFLDTFPFLLSGLTVLGLLFSAQALWRVSHRKRSLARIQQIAGPAKGSFTDTNNRYCAPPELVKYADAGRNAQRQGVLVEVFQDGDAVVLFRDTLRYETVTTHRLCKYPERGRWACEYGYHLNCVSCTGLLGASVVCFNCGEENAPERFIGAYRLRRAATADDKAFIRQLRRQRRAGRRSDVSEKRV